MKGLKERGATPKARRSTSGDGSAAIKLEIAARSQPPEPSGEKSQISTELEGASAITDLKSAQLSAPAHKKNKEKDVLKYGSPQIEMAADKICWSVRPLNPSKHTRQASVCVHRRSFSFF